MTRSFLAGAAIALCCAGARAAPDPAPKEPATPPAPANPLPDLDDLLNIPREARPAPKPSDPAAPGAAAPPGTPADADPMKAELDRRLSGRQVEENFLQAVTMMSDAAKRLGGAGDAGLTTQRVQDEIVRRLDQVIEAARASQQQQQSKSRSSSSQQQQQPRPMPQQQAGRQNQPGKGDNQGEVDPPAPQSGKVKELIESSAASWGALPQRVRDALLQGSGDRFSSLYQALTEEYYRRLAEEGKQPE